MQLTLRGATSPVAVLLCSLLCVTAIAMPGACPSGLAFKEHPVKASNIGGPKTQGILWRIKPHRGAPSSLFGTMHVTEITRLPPLVALSLAKADTLVTETVLDKPGTLYYQQHMYSDRAPNLDSLFQQPFRKRLLDLLNAYGVDRKTALQLKPWAAFSLLSRPIPTGAPTLDQIIEATARQQGKPVHGLQSVEELVSALEGIPLPQQRAIVMDTVCNRAQIERQARQLTARYLDEDLAGMLAESKRYEPHNKAVARTFNKRLLNDRSQQMLKRLQPYLEQGNAFIAVGALHLPGDEGLLQGLKARGYQLNAVY